MKFSEIHPNDGSQIRCKSISCRAPKSPPRRRYLPQMDEFRPAVSPRAQIAPDWVKIEFGDPKPTRRAGGRLRALDARKLREREKTRVRFRALRAPAHLNTRHRHPRASASPHLPPP